MVPKKTSLFSYGTTIFSDAIRIFNKVLKPAYGFLRMRGFQSVSYVDDNFLQGDVWRDCQDNINATTNVLTCLGYTIHMEKSILEPRQEIEFLGFVQPHTQGHWWP